jgi:hypothetical protein
MPMSFADLVFHSEQGRFKRNAAGIPGSGENIHSRELKRPSKLTNAETR